MVEMELIKLCLKKIFSNFRTLLKWSVLALITGLTVGGISTLFAYLLHLVTDFRTENTGLILFLPLAGVFLVFLYGICDYRNDKGTNTVISTIHAETEVPFRMAPLIFVSTLITHLFGGSAGREGAALQLGGSMGNQLGRWFRLDEKDRHIMVMCGMSAAFSSIFGTPLAASVFSIEVASVGIMHYAALVPCALASLIASEFAIDMGINPELFTIHQIPAFHFVSGAKVLLLSVCCAGVSVLFCASLHWIAGLFKNKFGNPYVRVLVASAIIIGITILLQTADYMGAGVPVIERAIEGEVRPEAFLVKMLLTAITLAAGFKGGEIVPSFFIGATFGCLFGQLVGISPSLCAALGMLAVFCGVTNCPISSMFIAFELFGYKAVPFFMIAISVSYMTSGYYGLYHDQRIIYSKSKTEFINRRTHD